MDLLRNELKNLQEVRTMESRFIATNSHLLKSFLPGNRKEVLSHFLRRIESAYLLGLNNDMPGPAKKAFQKTSYTVSGGNPSIKRSRTKSIIFPLVSRTNDLSYSFSQY